MDEDGTVLLHSPHVELLTHVFRLMLEHTHHGCSVHHEAVLLAGFPFGIEHIGFGTSLLGHEQEGGRQPVSVLLHVEMNLRGIHLQYGFLGQIAHILVGSQ